MAQDLEPAARRSVAWVGLAGWGVAMLVVGGLALLGGWLIGLEPVFTVTLLVVLAVVSLALVVVRGRRRTERTPTGEPVGLAAVVGRVVLTGVGLLLVIQVLPLGRDHANPAVAGEPAWPSPRTRELMVNACFGCHSNEVEWPWYSNVAPMSWAISDHVEEGREAVNYSEFAADPGEAEETIEVIRDQSMPPAYFTRFGLHPEAKLSEAEIAELVAGLQATPGLADEGGAGGGEGGNEDED